MKIAFYSTGGMMPQSAFTPALTFFPRRAAVWDILAEEYKEHKIAVFAILPSTHLIDAKREDILCYSENVEYHVLPEDASVKEISEIIASWQPDCAVAYSLPDAALDWNPVRDSLVGHRLERKGIRVIAHDKKTAMDCFKKYDTNRIVRKAGFNAATGVYVQGLLYYADRRNREINHNVYKDYLREQLESLKFPVVVKPAAGSGSVGIYIADDIDSVIRHLDSIDTECDLVVEEKVEGYNFGIEVYGRPGHYMVTEAVMFSMTEDGVTDPFASVKFGPIKDDRYRIDELKEQMEALAEELKFNGIAEIDLVFNGDKWYVIEINPRFSLLSAVGCAMRGEKIFDPLMRLATGADRIFNEGVCLFTLDFKSELIDNEEIDKIMDRYEMIKSVMKFECRVAEGVDIGYCEWIISGKTKKELETFLTSFGKTYPNILTDSVMKSADQLGVIS